jgi:hypothetical protein
MKAQKERLYKDVELLTGVRPFRNYKNLASLRFVANYIKSEFQKAGLACEEQKWTAKGNEYKNIIASYNVDKKERLVIGAHYDVFDEQAGADDNASGIAGLLESARLIAENKPALDYRIDFVAYCLEEPPFFGKHEMGSYVHAKSLKKAKAEVLGMICFEMIGYFSDLPGSQPNPVPALIDDIPDTGNFIVVAGLRKYRNFNERVHALMSENEEMDTRVIHFPTKYGLVGLSDHSSYWKFGYTALMITDTALVRNHRNYHSISDIIETLDFEKMTQVVNSSYIAFTKL